MNIYMSDVTEKSFEELYEAVFDENGKTKSCGREKCRELIDYVWNTFHVLIGDSRTGFITETNTVQRLYSSYIGVRK